MKVYQGKLGIDVGAGGKPNKTEVGVVGESVLSETQLKTCFCVEEIPEPMAWHIQTKQLKEEGFNVDTILE